MPLLKVADVATRLNCSLATAYALIDKGELPSIRIGAGGAVFA